MYGAVFIGQGRVMVEPYSSFEKESVQRFLKSDRVDLNFTTAVLRFTDDTYDLLAKLGRANGGVPPEAQKLAAELDPRLVRETGLNLSARILSAIVNGDQPGVFFGEFNGGKRGRFDALLDHQTQALQTAFGINAGEKGLLFQHASVLTGTDVWTAFYDEQDFRNGRVLYADAFDLVSIPEYRMQVDLRDADHWIRNNAELDMIVLRDGPQIIPMALNENLGENYDQRLKKGVRVTGASLSDGGAVGVIQDEWDTGVSLVLPQPLNKGQKVTVKLELQGEHSFATWQSDFHYPLSTETWYPRHGYLSRSRFDLKFLHKQNTLVVSCGQRVREEASGAKDLLTEWVTPDPVALVTFAVGRFERHTDTVTVGDKKIPVEFYSVPSSYGAVDEGFVLAELTNGVNFFSQLFGGYPYSRLGAAYFPSNFGQGFPTLILLPEEGRASLRHFSFISHEISHQWWGDLVAWRSYRDQWLSEGFAEYSAALYASRRDNPKRALDLVKDMRRELQAPPATDTGVGSGKLYEVGPLIMGHRLSSRRSGGAYTALVYSKGALTLRMLHFLFSDPTGGNDDRFYQMMKDFVQANRNGAATTESFFALASQRFVQTPIGQKYGFTDLDWFLQQWVYRTEIPSYRLEYHLEPRPGGGTLFSGTLYQEGVPVDWVMPLPILFDFGDGKGARGTICARGPMSTVKIGLPAEPKKVLLDPDLWVLTSKVSESTAK
ncbi:MAG: hypothetical protein LAN83_02025 [Acidobacteriia bacterium]|nr:hypothetical protein [Terriglobia bacterium]